MPDAAPKEFWLWRRPRDGSGVWEKYPDPFPRKVAAFALMQETMLHSLEEFDFLILEGEAKPEAVLKQAEQRKQPSLPSRPGLWGRQR